MIVKKEAPININFGSQISDGPIFEVINFKAPIYSKFLIAFKSLILQITHIMPAVLL